MIMIWFLQEIPPGDYKQPYGATGVSMEEERQGTVEPKNEVGLQEDTEWRAEMREKGGYEENNQKMRVETFEQKFKTPDADGTRDLMQQMNTAWHRISGSPLLPACSDRKVSMSTPLYRMDLIKINVPIAHYNLFSHNFPVKSTEMRLIGMRIVV